MESYHDEILDTPCFPREVVINESKFEVQGYKIFSCEPLQKQCRTMRCDCFKKNVLCGSKCNSNLSWGNK